MKRVSFLLNLILFFLLSCLLTSHLKAQEKNRSYTSGIPFYFEENKGQWEKPIKFRAKFKNYIATFGNDSWAVLLDSKGQKKLKFEFVDSNPESLPKGKCQLAGKINYLTGNKESSWITNVPTSDRIVYAEKFPGTNLEFYEKSGFLEYDIIVKPGSNPELINFKIEGAKKIETDLHGNLIILTFNSDTIIQLLPSIYQFENGKKHSINGEFIIFNNDIISFHIDDYNPDLSLIIDPYVLAFSSFLGGSGYEDSNCIANDNQGNIYVAGETTSTSLGTSGVFQVEHSEIGVIDDSNDDDAFLAKISPDGTNLEFFTYLGGNEGRDIAKAIAVSPEGMVYLVGGTSSEDFPMDASVQEPFQTEIPPGNDFNAFLAVFNSDGNSLNYCSMLGGSEIDIAYGVELNSEGEVYIVGETNSADFPTREGFDNTKNGDINTSDIFVAKLNPGLGGDLSLIFSSYLGGSQDDGLGALIGSEVDFGLHSINGSIYLAGYSESTDFPVHGMNILQGELNGLRDAFFVKIDSDGNEILYSTYIGGSNSDMASELQLHLDNGVIIAGDSNSEDFDDNYITDDAFFNIGPDAFLIRLTELEENEFSLGYGTFLPQGSSIGTAGETMDLASTPQGYIAVCSRTTESDLPVSPNAIQDNLVDGSDVFLVIFSPSGEGLVYSTYLGGSSDEGVRDIDVDNQGNILLTGYTRSSDYIVFPEPPLPFQPLYAGPEDADFIYGDGFITKLHFIQTFQANYEYPAKILCGSQRSPNISDLARGVYRSSINIHSPYDTNHYFLKLALSHPSPEGLEPGRIIPINIGTLYYDEAIQVGCNYIQRELFPEGLPASYIEGFLVIQSQDSLDITGVYSSSGFGGNRHSSIDIEQIPIRRIINREIQSVSDLEISKEILESNPFNAVTYQITVRNNGLIPAENVVITENIEAMPPALIGSISETPNPEMNFILNSIDGGSGSFTVSLNNPIPPAGSFTFGYNILFSYPDGFEDFTILNNASVSSTSPELIIENNSVSLESRIQIDP